MCTEPAPAAKQAAQRFLATNPGDPATFETVADLEAEVVSSLGSIAGLDTAHGYVTGGGTEANIQAVRAARNRSDAVEPNVVAPTSAHFSLRKATSLLDVELRSVETTADERADPQAMAEAADDATALVSVSPGRPNTVGSTRSRPSRMWPILWMPTVTSMRPLAAFSCRSPTGTGISVTRRSIR
jgi:Glutamate decarboxylase and related PLP-dependent proteins